MSDPYRILGLRRESVDDAAVQAAYLEGLRAHAPDRDPRGFQRLRIAYEQLRTRRRRLEHDLFHHEVPALADLAARLLAPGTPRRPSPEQIRRALGTADPAAR
ncbi:MAG: J domain-containing protein [Nitrococcus sp.]|nr:J domain-containing protein [Nitrococcus sp.]